MFTRDTRDTSAGFGREVGEGILPGDIADPPLLKTPKTVWWSHVNPLRTPVTDFGSDLSRLIRLIYVSISFL